MDAITRTLSIPALDVRRVIGTGLGPRDPTSFTEKNALWRAWVTPAGPATFRVAWKAGEVEAAAWGDGATHILDQLPDLLGLHDTPEEFRPKDARMAELVRQRPGLLRLGRGQRIVDVLLRTILGQRVTTGEANSAYRRIVFAHSERAPGPQRLWLPPAPERMRRLRPFEIQGDDLDRQRAATLLRACMHFRKLDARQHEAASDVATFLQKIPGIGPWTAMNTVAETHGWADAVPVGDYHLPNMVAFALAGEPRGTDARMVELLEPYVGHRYRVLQLLALSGIKAPTYGAKRAPWAFYVNQATRRHGGGER